MTELHTPILIVGGGTGGSAAALACARLGADCIVTEPSDWVGGQLTVQAVPPDENRWIEDFGGNRSYQELREGVRRYYRQVRGGLRPSAAADPRLNPGNGWVSRLCAEPRIWHDVLAGMLAAAGFRSVIDGHTLVPEPARGGPPERRPRSTASGRFILPHHEPLSAECEGDRVRAVTFRNSRTGEVVSISADLVLDATETGDLLELGGIEHAIGAEHRDVYGELHGRTDFDPKQRTDPIDQQACSWCFALEHRPGESHVIDRPARYSWWRSYVPDMRPGWCGAADGRGGDPLFSWRVPSHSPPGCRTLRMIPWPDEPPPGELEMWRYRRIVDSSLYEGGEEGGSGGRPAHPDVSLINMVQMDYWQKPLLGVLPAEREAALAGAREQSLCWLHWMQTEAPRHDGKGQGYPGLKLRGDELGTRDGFAKSVYIREPRRLIARTIVTEAHIGTEQRRADGWHRRDPDWGRVDDGGRGWGTGERFRDSVGIGHYMIDLHPSCAGRNNVYVPATPFRVPMGSLVPARVRNVLAAGKCLGVTHITNGAYRMHHVEWAAGEAAGTLAAWCIGKGTEPHAVHEDPGRVREVQRVLGEQGVRLAWPWEE